MVPPGATSRARRRSASWWADALLWALTAAVTGAMAFVAIVGALGIIANAARAGVLAGVIVGMLYIMPFALFGALVLALPFYLLVLLAWGCIGPRRIDRSAVRLGVALALLALPAGMIGYLWAAEFSLARAAMLWGATWAGLLLPRMMLPRLRPGAFGGGGREEMATG